MAKEPTEVSPRLLQFYKDNDIEMVKILGSGSYSTVVLAKVKKYEKEHPQLAIKNIDRRQSGDYVKRFLPREIEIVKTCNHANICRVFEIMEFKHYVCFVTELCEGGDLLDKINGQKFIPEADAKLIFRQLVEALSYLIEREIVHRDIKCENIFLDKHGNVKLGDFGFARYLRVGEKSSTYCGSRAYVAPEILRSVEYTGHTVDIWSAGVVLFVMLTGMMPFNDKKVPAMVNQQLQHRIRFPKQPVLSLEACTLIFEILHPHPHSRPTCHQMKNSEWLKKTTYTMKGPKVSSRNTVNPAGAAVRGSKEG